MRSFTKSSFIPSFDQGVLVSGTKALLSSARSVVSSLTNSDRELAAQIREMVEITLPNFPWRFVITDWTGQEYAVGGNEPHWNGRDGLHIHIKRPAAGRDLLVLDIMRFLVFDLAPH